MQLQTVRPNIVQSIRAYRVQDLMEAAEHGGQHFLYANLSAVQSKQEVLDAGVQIGDPAVYADGWQPLIGDRVAGRAMDNRVGAWVVAEAVRRTTVTQHIASYEAALVLNAEAKVARSAKASAKKKVAAKKAKPKASK